MRFCIDIDGAGGYVESVKKYGGKKGRVSYVVKDNEEFVYFI